MDNSNLNPIIFYVLNIFGIASFISLITISTSTVPVSSEFFLIEWGSRSVLYFIILFLIIFTINYLTKNKFLYHPAITAHLLILNILVSLNFTAPFFIIALAFAVFHYFQLRRERIGGSATKKNNQTRSTKGSTNLKDFTPPGLSSRMDDFIKSSEFDKKNEVKAEKINEFVNSNEVKSSSSLDNKIDVLETEIEELEKLNEKKQKIKELEQKLKDLKGSLKD